MSDTCITDRISAVRAQLRMGGPTTSATLDEIAALLREAPDSPALWILRGRAIQLCASDCDPEEARKSFERALALDPGHREAADELERWNAHHSSG